MLNINEDDLKRAIIERAADQIIGEGDHLSSLIQKEVVKRIDVLFATQAEAQIKAAINDAIQVGFEREYQKVNSWGEPDGPKTSIKKSLEVLVNGYWSAKVDPKTGKATSSDYNSVTRAEYVMTQVCGEKFSEQMGSHVLSVAGHLKDGLRNQLAQHLDKMLNDLFRVRSLQDQGKVEKPF